MQNVEEHDERFRCQFCPMTFSRNSSVKRHMVVHTGEKPFGCPKCSRKFTQGGNLKIHLQTIHHTFQWRNRRKTEVQFICRLTPFITKRYWVFARGVTTFSAKFVTKHSGTITTSEGIREFTPMKNHINVKFVSKPSNSLNKPKTVNISEKSRLSQRI